MCRSAKLLGRLAFSPLRVRLRMLEPWTGSEFKGSRLRGGLGTFLRRQVCTNAGAKCDDCPVLPGCVYVTLFETPVQPDTFPILRVYKNAPHPFVLAVPEDRRRSIPTGGELEFGFTAIGFANDSLPLLIEAFDGMGASGDYGGRFRVDSVRSTLEPGFTLYAAGRGWNGRTAPQWSPPEEPSGEMTIRIRFPWPLRLVVERELCEAPQFIDIIRGLLRRLHILAVLYGGSTEPYEVLHPLLDLARTARHLEVAWRHAPLERESLRQNKRVPLDGAIGGLVVRGALGALVPFLEAGRWLHVGKGSSLGLGGFELEVKQREQWTAREATV